MGEMGWEISREHIIGRINIWRGELRLSGWSAHPLCETLPISVQEQEAGLKR